MFEVLLESRHVKPPRPVVATLVSTALHVALVLLVVGGTTAVVTSEEMNPVWDRLARFLAPPSVPSNVGGERVAFVGIEAPGSPKGDEVGAPTPVKENEFQGLPVVPQRVSQAIQLTGLTQLAIAAQSLSAFTIIDVDSVAERDPLSAAPAYPREMLQRNIEGSVVMRFVIDSTGVVDLATVRVMSSTHDAFVRAVREAMPRMKFRPALRNAIPVRQLVEQPYVFRIEPPAAPPARQPS